jgi:hypothetical protein
MVFINELMLNEIFHEGFKKIFECEFWCEEEYSEQSFGSFQRILHGFKMYWNNNVIEVLVRAINIYSFLDAII